MVSRTFSFFAAALLFAGAQATAQTQQVVPRIYKDLEGYGSFQYPLSYQNHHFQEIILGTEVATNGAQIRAIWFRRDGATTTVYSAKALNMEVTLYETPFSPLTMSKTWATNRGSSTGTLVFKGQVNLPGSSQPPTLPAPWVVKIPFSTPFSYAVKNGNLLMETYNRDPYLYSRWSADCTRQSVTAGGGEEGYVGLACTGTGGNTLKFKIDEHALMPGGSVDTDFTPTNLASSVAWVGLSTKSFGPVSLPFDLTPLGAPGCMIYTEFFHLVALPTTGKAIWPIPNSAFMVNQIVYIQGAGLATNANALGLVTSECRFAKIGSGSPQDPGTAECVFRIKDNSNPTGYQAGSSLNTAPILLLEGVFF